MSRSEGASNGQLSLFPIVNFPFPTQQQKEKWKGKDPKQGWHTKDKFHGSNLQFVFT